MKKQLVNKKAEEHRKLGLPPTYMDVIFSIVDYRPPEYMEFYINDYGKLCINPNKPEHYAPPGCGYGRKPHFIVNRNVRLK